MGRKLEHAPVYFAIIQARFNLILALDTYAPKIQEWMRKHGFPDTEKGFLTTMKFAPVAPTEGSPPQVPVEQSVRYVFRNAERTQCFLLEQGALSFQTTEYDVFETFSKAFLDGLQAVHEIVELSYTDRIGFRYLDAVFPKADEPLSQYLAASVLGLSESVDAKVVHAFSEALIKANDVSVVARCIVQEGPIGFPPDLLPLNLAVQKRFEALNGRHAILDTDGSYDGREGYDTDGVRARLKVIHDEIGRAFRATVTDKALKAWE